MSKIKVLHISQAAGGVERHVISVLERMDRGKFEISGICPPRDLVKGVSPDKESFVDAFKRIGVEVYPVAIRREIRPFSDVSAFFKIYNFIRKGRFDVVHTHSSKAGFLGRIAARAAGAPVVVHTPNSFAFDRPAGLFLPRLFYAMLERFAGLFCDKVIAVCEDERCLVNKFHILPDRKIEVMSNAVDLSLYGVFKADIAKKRQELGVAPGAMMIVQAGRMARQKAPFDFIKAAALARREFPDAMFFLLGDGPLSAAVRKYIAARDLAGFVKFLGWRTDVREITAASDIFVLSSLWEVLPNYSVSDAMALEKPVVITNTLGARDIVRDGYNGFVTPSGRPRELAAAIVKLLRHSGAELKEWGRRSREMLGARPGLEEVVRKIENLYERLLCEKHMS